MYLTKTTLTVDDIDNSRPNTQENTQLNTHNNTRDNTQDFFPNNFSDTSRPNTATNTATDNTDDDFTIDFVTEIIYTADKVTPINLGSREDERVNQMKIFDTGKRNDIIVMWMWSCAMTCLVCVCVSEYV